MAERRTAPRALVWFRADLRVADNPALAAAAAEADGGVIALFVASPAQWRRHDWGAARAGWTLRSLAPLSESLRALGIPLRFVVTPTFDDAPAAVVSAARAHGCATVYWNAELEVDERRRDEAVREALTGEGIGWRCFADQTVVPEPELRTAAGNAFVVFGPFYRRWCERLTSRGAGEPLPPPRPRAALADDADPLPSGLEGYPAGGALGGLWPAGEAEAHRRLHRFLDTAAATYHRRRDLPADAATSTLSPYLATGAISPRAALHAAVVANGGEIDGGAPGLAAWIRQLAWRDFYRCVVAAFPRVSMGRAFRPAGDRVAWRHDPDALDAWRAGRTGFPIVDAGMRELAATGWMHNRARMITASFLVKDLLIDWRLGEAHFVRMLVDADLANNNGGWQWSASTGTDAAPYFRILSPWRQSERFDPDGRYVRRWVPELEPLAAGALHDPRRLAAALAGIDYPPPIVDHGAARRRALEAFAAAH